MTRNLLVLLFMLLGATVSWSQTRTVSGKVSAAEDGSALPGANVQIKGTTSGTTTNADGEYSLEVNSGTVLVFSYVGMLAQEVSIGSQSIINISLNSDSQVLSEVVVTGYGTQQRRDVTGSVGTIKGDGMKNIAMPSFDRNLQGQVAGVQASTPSGILGQPAKVRIRGTNSISNSSDPLYVVDGLPFITGDQGQVIANNPLGDINPNDIESIEVLKDGSATAIYGSRAANGVILITTKRGKLGAPKVTYDGWLAISQSAKKYDVLNANEFIEVANRKLANAGLDPAAFPTLNPQTNQPYNTDWQDIIMRNGFQHNHALSFSGATAQTNYFFSAGYSNMEGNILANDQKRFNFRAKLDQKAFNDKVTFGMNSFVTHTTLNGQNTNYNGLSGNVAGALYAFPNVPAQWPDGSYNISANGSSLGEGANLRSIAGNYTNQKFILDNNIYKNATLNLTGNAFVDVEIVKGLNAKTFIGINYLNGEDFLYWNPEHGDGSSVGGRIYQYNTPSFRYNWQNTLSYNRSFGQHKINAVAGYESQKTRSRYFFAHGTSLSNTYFGINENIISSTLTNQFIGGSANERAFTSTFGRVSYSLMDRYLLTATLRNDKISSLPHGNQNATLPGVSVGWRLSEEDFFKKMDPQGIVSELKLRGGWAKVGNVEIGSYPYAGLFGAAQYGDWSGIRFTQAGNGALSFETSKKLNLGLDVSLWANRVSFNAEYFKNNIDNLILATPTPPSLGIPGNTIAQNIGEMYNKGWEFTLSTVNMERGAFSWRSNLNLTLVKNRVTRLVNGAPIINTYNITQEGGSIGAIYGFVSRGVNSANGWAMYEKADGSVVQIDPSTGNWRKYNSASPGDVSEAGVALSTADKRILGEGNPTWFGGFNNSFTYGNFDLGVFFTFSGGNKIYNYTRHESLNNQDFANGGRELLNAWEKEGDQTDVPILYYGSGGRTNLNGNAISRFVEDGAFLRLQTLSLGYNLPTNLLSKVKVNNFRVFAQVQNVFVATNYTGADPDLSGTVTLTNSAANNTPGVDLRVNPIPRVYTLGFNVGF